MTHRTGLGITHFPYHTISAALADGVLDDEDDLPDPDVDCGHCITPEDRCSDISDRNCAT
jgi:hypothetical protein